MALSNPFRRRRATTATPIPATPAGAAVTDASASSAPAAATPAAAAGTAPVATVPIGGTAPAGLAIDDLLGPPPTSRRRTVLRRRLRYLRRVRDLMLRDLGGLMLEIHRSAPSSEARNSHARLVSAKLERLTALDAERRTLEGTLGDRRDGFTLREPGIGGTCPSCGAYFPSDARYCVHCGRRLDGTTGGGPLTVEAMRQAAVGHTVPDTAAGVTSTTGPDGPAAVTAVAAPTEPSAPDAHRPDAATHAASAPAEASTPAPASADPTGASIEPAAQ